MSDNLEEIKQQVLKGLEVAVATSEYKIIKTFIAFFREVIAETLAYGKIDDFEYYINFPYWIYDQISKALATDSSRNIVEICDILPLHLREMITLINSYSVTAETNEQKSELNKFYESGFRSFSNLFYLQSTFYDWKLLKSSIDKFSQLESDLSSSAILKAQLKDLERLHPEQHIDKIRELEQEISIREQFIDLKRHTLLVLKYWIYHLFENKQISAEDASKILKAIENCRMEYKDAQDIIFLRQSNLSRYFNWEQWKFEERAEGIQHNVVTAKDWITKGFLIDRLRGANNNFMFDREKVDSEQIKWLLDDIRSEAMDAANLPQTLKPITSSTNFQKINLTLQSLIENLEALTQPKISISDFNIANSPLSEEKIQNFAELVEQKWLKNTRIRRIFNLLGNLENISGQERKLMRIGPHLFLEKGKMMFIDGAYHEHIYGMEDIGFQVAKQEDDLFFERILKAKAQHISRPNLSELLTHAINRLQRNGVQPNVILLEPEHLYLDPEFLESNKYSPEYKSQLNEDDVDFFVIGTFEGVPLYTSYSRQIKNKVVVADFNSAFKMLYKSNNHWYSRLLSIIIKDVDEDLARQKLAAQPMKWGKTDDGEKLTEQESLTLIKTSVVLDVETLLDFDVKDVTKYIVGELER